MFSISEYLPDDDKSTEISTVTRVDLSADELDTVSSKRQRFDSKSSVEVIDMSAIIQQDMLLEEPEKVIDSEMDQEWSETTEPIPHFDFN